MFEFQSRKTPTRNCPKVFSHMPRCCILRYCNSGENIALIHVQRVYVHDERMVHAYKEPAYNFFVGLAELWNRIPWYTRLSKDYRKNGKKKLIKCHVKSLTYNMLI